jgi:benzoate-CoA ligase family protein
VIKPEAYNLVDDSLDRHIREGRGSKPAVVCEQQALTYADVARRVNRFGNGLLQLGIQDEQRVLLVLPDRPEFVIAYLGTMKIGAVAVPASTALRAADYAYFLTESRSRAVIVHSSLYAEVAPAFAGQRHLRHVVVCGEAIEGRIHWDSWLAGQSDELDCAPTHRDDVGFWLWTSGSTGRPKAAVHLHRDWLVCCQTYARSVLGLQANDVTFSTSKLFHAYGLGNALMFPFHVGATTVLHPLKPQAQSVLDLAQAQRPTLLFSVPSLYALMLQESSKQNYDLSSVRLAVSAAEPLPAEIYRRWKERFGCEILDGIGSTEALHIYMSSKPGRVRPGSSGEVVPGYHVRIEDPDGRPTPPGAIGDLLVKGESTATCYWNHRQLSAERMRGEWFFTGDKYWMDPDGYFWYAGRADDMFRVSGQWVSPAEVEGALIEHPAVLEAAVVAFEEDTKLHTPKAFVVLKEGFTGDSALVKALQDFVKSRITPYKYPRRIEFLLELPKSAAGKVLRYKLRERNA